MIIFIYKKGENDCDQIKVMIITICKKGENACDQRPRQHCDVSEGKETWAEKYQGAAFIVVPFFNREF